MQCIMLLIVATLDCEAIIHDFIQCDGLLVSPRELHGFSSVLLNFLFIYVYGYLDKTWFIYVMFLLDLRQIEFVIN